MSRGAARLVLVRHAEPDESVRGRVYGRLDVDLSAAGRVDAERIAALLRAQRVAAVYTSPLRRAVATAEPLARALALRPVTVDALREIDFGELEGLRLEEVEKLHPEHVGWTAASADTRFPGGESVSALRARAAGAARGLAQRHQGQTIVVCSHAVVIRAVLADALVMPPEAMFRLDQSYGGISVVDWFDAVPLVRVVNASRFGP